MAVQGAKNHGVVMPDANKDHALNQVKDIFVPMLILINQMPYILYCTHVRIMTRV